jgi:Leucine-rich repeat (LRR) protein
MTAHNLRVLVAAVLLVFLSATTIPAPITAQARLAPAAFDCSTVTEIPSSECQALVALYASTNGAGWTDSTSWLASNTPCNWYGIMCWSEHVVQVMLPSNQLSGSIPPQLGNLANLAGLALDHNQLSGSIPPQLGNLANLQDLNLWSNQLSGSIPPELGNLTNLGSLALGENQLSGSIPPQLGNLANLAGLYLYSNHLSGSIPPELGNLVNLLGINLSSNQLSGSIPPELGNLAKLKQLVLPSNQLRGLVPQSLTNLHALYSFGFDTGLLCVPDNSAFAAWLAGIAYHSTGAPTCKTCYLPSLMR